MCTSIIVNRKKTIVGWNLDLMDMEYRMRNSIRGWDGTDIRRLSP